MSVRRRPFPEVLDALLTTLVGGVACEEHPFPPPLPDDVADPQAPYEHHLEQPPAADVVSVYGSRNGEEHEFRRDVDYELSESGTTVTWTDAAQLPDPGTLVSITYTSAAARTALNDVSVGSVMRTLAEATAHEVARLYAQLEAVYEAGFIDTASGDSLDNVVALLGVERVRGGRPVGDLQFERVAGGRGEITIPVGTRVVTDDGEVEYATTGTATLADRQTVVRVRARDVEPNDPLPAGVLTVMPVPIAGLVSVTNPVPTVRAAIDESDIELRARTKAFLGGSERATIGALRGAIAHQQITADVEETAPGRIVVTPHAATLPPELEQRLLAAIEYTRPAGVVVELRAPVPPELVDVELRLTTTPQLLESAVTAAHEGVVAVVRDAFERLPIRESLSLTRIAGRAMAIRGVEDIRFLGARLRAPAGGGATGPSVLDLARGEITLAGKAVALGELRIVDPALATLLTVTVTGLDADEVRPALAAEVARINAANAREGAAGEVVTYAQLVSVLEWDPEGGRLALALSQPTGFSFLLSPDASYQMTPFERLTFALNAYPGTDG